jgi:hypothetical protein
MSAPDRVLLDAEQQLAELRSIMSDDDDDGDEGIWPVVDTISYTAPLTVAGAAAKLRLLCDENIGILAGHSKADEASLRQVLAFVEALARRVAAR